MVIGCDKNQLTGTHKKSNEANHRRMMAMGHEIMPLPIPYGDYIEVTPTISETIKRRGDKLKKMDLVNDIKIAVDRKNSIDEICGNICSSKSQHERFREEAITAQKAGAKFYVVIETEGFTFWSRTMRKSRRWMISRSGLILDYIDITKSTICIALANGRAFTTKGQDRHVTTFG